jgi:DNA-binding response OmpR family regulator
MKGRSDYLLLVEDDPDILKLLDTTLRFKGYRVVTARNGREGLEAIQVERPAIVIADIMMPRLDGFGLVHRMRINPVTRDIPVIFITATYVAPEDREFALNIGATRFIQKPVDLEKFLATVVEVLEKGPEAVNQPLNEVEFYQEYRRRLQTKLEEKNRQILRDEQFLGTSSPQEGEFLQASLRRAIAERDELKLLLGQIHEQIQKFDHPEWGPGNRSHECFVLYPCLAVDAPCFSSRCVGRYLHATSRPLIASLPRPRLLLLLPRPQLRLSHLLYRPQVTNRSLNRLPVLLQSPQDIARNAVIWWCLRTAAGRRAHASACMWRSSAAGQGSLSQTRSSIWQADPVLPPSTWLPICLDRGWMRF